MLSLACRVMALSLVEEVLLTDPVRMAAGVFASLAVVGMDHSGSGWGSIWIVG